MFPIYCIFKHAAISNLTAPDNDILAVVVLFIIQTFQCNLRVPVDNLQLRNINQGTARTAGLTCV